MRFLQCAAALIVAGLLTGCGGGMVIGGPEPDTLANEMVAPDPMATGEIDDATGTMIP